MKKNKDTMGMTPKQIVAELDRFIIGQNEAKKQWAIALRENEPDPDIEDCFIFSFVIKEHFFNGLEIKTQQ